MHAFSCNHAAVTAAADPFAIPRIDISRAYNLDDFKAIVSGHWDYLGRVQSARAYLRPAL